jgi:hypothetical protein
MNPPTIRDLFYQHEGRLIHKWDHYFEIYDKYFSPFRGQPIHILEIGISHGGSLQLWKKYFGDTVTIYGIDINPECKKFEEEGVKVFIGSQEDVQFLDTVRAALPALDIIIDDGGHTMSQQITSFEKLFLQLKEGGIYLVEDTHTSYWHEFHGGLRKKGSFIEYSKNLIDSLYEGHVYDKRKILINEITGHMSGISFYDSIVVFEKIQRPAPYHIRKGSETIEPYQPTTLKKPSILMKIRERFFGKVDTWQANDRGKI